MTRLLWWLRLRWKLALRRVHCVDSFCKRCGRDVRDFAAPEAEWLAVASRLRHGSVACYDCFCDLSGTVAWRLAAPEGR